MATYGRARHAQMQTSVMTILLAVGWAPEVTIVDHNPDAFVLSCVSLPIYTRREIELDIGIKPALVYATQKIVIKNEGFVIPTPWMTLGGVKDAPPVIDRDVEGASWM